MKIIVFGATGLAGKQIVKELLKKGATVTVYIRQDTFFYNGVSIINGGLDDEQKIAASINGFGVIISAVGNRNYEDPAQVVTPFVRLISRVIASYQRFVVVAGSGLTLFNYNTLRRDLPGQPDFLKNQRADHWDAYCHLAPLDINYLVICPTMIVEGDADGNYLHLEKYFPKSESRQISAGNVGHFIAGEVISPAYHQTRIGLVNK